MVISTDSTGVAQLHLVHVPFTFGTGKWHRTVISTDARKNGSCVQAFGVQCHGFDIVSSHA